MRLTLKILIKYVSDNGGSYRIDKRTHSSKYSFGKSFRYELVKINKFDGADKIVSRADTLTDLIRDFPFFSKFFVLGVN